MIKTVNVFGAGSAGFMAALSLKRKIPQLTVRVIRSPEIGVIGVGESTTPQFPHFVFNFLGIKHRAFYAAAKPTWKIGIHFLWGQRNCFEYAFDFALDRRVQHLPMPIGFYCKDDFTNANVDGALMLSDKAFVRNPNGGGPIIGESAAFHLYNPTLVDAFEMFARDAGVEIIDAKIVDIQRGPMGIKSLIADDGRVFEADFFVDASGFRSELLGKTLSEPFISYDNSLYNDRAVLGSWDSTDADPILPYTVAETMDCGWCWRIDHEYIVNRGYVYSSRFISDDQAAAELQRKNPRATIHPHVIKLRTGRYRRGWVDNVWAIGNSCGFVEPLEATALMIIAGQCESIVQLLLHCNLTPTETMRDLYNKIFADGWDSVRDFLAIHYRFNRRLDNDYWITCRNEADISGSAELIKFYQQNGPTGLIRHLLRSTAESKNSFGAEGFLVLLTGQQVPYECSYKPTEQEMQIWRHIQMQNRNIASQGMDAREALKYIRHPQWRWNTD